TAHFGVANGAESLSSSSSSSADPRAFPNLISLCMTSSMAFTSIDWARELISTPALLGGDKVTHIHTDKVQRIREIESIRTRPPPAVAALAEEHRLLRPNTRGALSFV